MLDDVNILLVEDEALIALDLSDQFEAEGATVVGPFGSVEDAVARALGLGPKPDVAVLDVDLHGRPVFPLADKLSAAGVPFVFHTGRADLDELRARYGDVPVVPKPSMPDHLVRTVSTLL